MDDLQPTQIYSWADLGKRFDFKPGYLGAAGGMVSRPAQGARLLISHLG
jgi:hypothetical protein